LPRPNRIFDYDVAASPDDVDTTRSITAELEQMVKKAPRTKAEKWPQSTKTLSKTVWQPFKVQSFGVQRLHLFETAYASGEE
jgi:hypothetical protein